MWSFDITFDTRDGLQTTDPLFLNAAPWNQKENPMQVYAENCSQSAWTKQCEDQDLVTEQLYAQHCHCPFFVSWTYLLSHKWAQVLTIPLVCCERYFASTLSSTMGNYGNMGGGACTHKHTHSRRESLTSLCRHTSAFLCPISIPFLSPHIFSLLPFPKLYSNIGGKKK